MPAIYSITTAAHQPNMNAFFEAYGWGTGTYSSVNPLTTDAPPTLSSPATHFHNYNASAQPGDFALFSLAKAGTLPVNDVNGNPIPYGVGGVISEADALAAFSDLELFANDSSRNSGEFAQEQRDALGLDMIPPDI